jgi:hypothetical protein
MQFWKFMVCFFMETWCMFLYGNMMYVSLWKHDVCFFMETWCMFLYGSDVCFFMETWCMFLYGNMMYVSLWKHDVCFFMEAWCMFLYGNMMYVSLWKHDVCFFVETWWMFFMETYITLLIRLGKPKTIKWRQSSLGGELNIFWSNFLRLLSVHFLLSKAICGQIHRYNCANNCSPV